MRLDPSPRFPAEPGQAWRKLTDLFRDIAQQVNASADGQMVASNNARTSIPTTGSYTKGDFVRKLAPSVSGGSIVVGWLRITDSNSSGSNHTLNTDWAALTVPNAPIIDSYQFACSDLTTALAVASSVGYFRALYAGTITEVRASLLTSSSSETVTLDIIKNGSGSILSTGITIDAGEKTSETAATPASFSDATVADDDEFAVDIDAAGTGAKGLIVTVLVQRS